MSMTMMEETKAEELQVEEPKAVVSTPLRIGSHIPNFYVSTTKGNFLLHEWLCRDPEAHPWTLLFSYPGEFTPVCITELKQLHNETKRFSKMQCKLIGVSCSSIHDHVDMGMDAVASKENGCPEPEPSCFDLLPGICVPFGMIFNNMTADDNDLKFPMIADEDRKIVTSCGMLDSTATTKSGLPVPARSLTILHGTKVKFTTMYPTNTGHNFDEVFRVLTSMQITKDTGLATPANWKYGEQVIVPPSLASEDREKFEGYESQGLPSSKVLVKADCPETCMQQP